MTYGNAETRELKALLALARHHPQQRIVLPPIVVRQRGQRVQANLPIGDISQLNMVLLERINKVEIAFSGVRHHQAKCHPRITPVIHHHQANQR